MPKSSSIFARVDPQIKEQAEAVLGRLGISMSNAVDIFFRQVIIHQGLPFEIKLKKNIPLFLNELDKTEFDAAIAEGIADIENGKTFSDDEAKEYLHKKLGI